MHRVWKNNLCGLDNDCSIYRIITQNYQKSNLAVNSHNIISIYKITVKTIHLSNNHCLPNDIAKQNDGELEFPKQIADYYF